MKAIVQDRYGPPDVLELREVAKPEVGPRDVLVRVRAAGVDPGVWHLMTGLPYLIRIMGYGLRTPKNPTPGTDLAGRVEAVGLEVTRFRPGDEVFGVADGSFAEYASTLETRLAPKPANLGFEEAAAIPASGITALQAVRDEAEIAAGESVLILGAGGGVGTFAVQLAKADGAEVTGVCSGAKADLVRSIGADRVIDYTREDFAGEGRRYDAILDTAGNRPLSVLRRALAPKGTLVIIGGERGGKWLGGLERQFGAVILSLFVRQRLRAQFPKKQEGVLDLLKEFVETGKMRPALDRTFPLAEAPGAIRYLMERRARGKVVLTA